MTRPSRIAFPSLHVRGVKAHRVLRHAWQVSLLTLAVSGCGSAVKHHRTGNLSNDALKVPGLTGARLALQSTALATAKAPWRATKVGARVLYDRAYSLVTGGLPTTSMKMDKASQTLPDAGSEEFEALLDREGLPPRSQGSLQFYVNGASFFPAYFRAIDGARQNIDVQAYIFDNDPFGMQAAERLKRKSQEVPVRVYFDSLGSLLAHKVDPPIPPPPGFKPPQNLRAWLQQDSNIQVRKTLNPYYAADHTKLHVIDDRIAFVGGMNMGVEYRHVWHDLMARIEGPVVGELARIYQNHWEGESWKQRWGLGGWFGKESPVIPAFPVSGRQVPLRVLRTDTPLGKREVLKAALAGIRCARRRVWMQTPYFSSDEISAELQKAVKRSVDVRVIVPGENDSKLMQKANAEELKKLLATGARVYEYPGMTHLKALVCDDWAMFGSANYDTLSLRINRELNLAFSDPATVRDFNQKVFERDFRVSSPLSLPEAKARGGIFAEVLGDQL